jgi:hypothetical protein
VPPSASPRTVRSWMPFRGGIRRTRRSRLLSSRTGRAVVRPCDGSVIPVWLDRPCRAARSGQRASRDRGTTCARRPARLDQPLRPCSERSVSTGPVRVAMPRCRDAIDVGHRRCWSASSWNGMNYAKLINSVLTLLVAAAVVAVAMSVLVPRRGGDGCRRRGRRGTGRCRWRGGRGGARRGRRGRWAQQHKLRLHGLCCTQDSSCCPGAEQPAGPELHDTGSELCELSRSSLTIAAGRGSADRGDLGLKERTRRFRNPRSAVPARSEKEQRGDGDSPFAVHGFTA